MPSWKRWLRYAKAKLDSTVRDANRELDRREADLEADRARKPWLGDESPTPSYEDAKARIEAMGGKGSAVAPSSGDPAFDLEKQQQAAADRLAEIRESLDLDDGDQER